MKIKFQCISDERCNGEMLQKNGEKVLFGKKELPGVIYSDIRTDVQDFRILYVTIGFDSDIH